MQRKPAVEPRALSRPEPVPDIADLMNDWFFGSARRGSSELMRRDQVVYAKGSRCTSAGRSTQEWLADARRMVDASPTGRESPARFVGSPRFAASADQQGGASPSLLDRRDPLSRSARRHRSIEGIGDEILSKSATHSRTRSEAFVSSATERPPAVSVQQRCTDTLHNRAPAAATSWSQRDDPDESGNGGIYQSGSAPSRLPKRPSAARMSRFSRASEEPQQPAVARQQPIPARSTAAPRCPEQEEGLQLLSPPKNLVESAHRRTISSSTCSSEKKLSTPAAAVGTTTAAAAATESTTPLPKDEQLILEQGDYVDAQQLNSFLRRQRAEIERISRGESSAKAKIILSGPSSKSTTSSMVAAICYAWLLERREIKGEGEEEEEEEEGTRERGRMMVVVVAPVMNMKRGEMWEHKQAAWLFQHVGIDAAALLFADEIDLEGLLMERQLSMLVVGHDILKTNSKVGSHCTVLTNDYCEDAYELLQREHLKKLLLAGILLDIQNLRHTAKFLTRRDTEAVQLLLVGFAPTYRDELLEQLVQEHDDYSFTEAMRNKYGKAPNDGMQKSLAGTPRLAHANNPAAKMAETASNGKHKFFWGKWFGFKSK